MSSDLLSDFTDGDGDFVLVFLLDLPPVRTASLELSLPFSTSSSSFGASTIGDSASESMSLRRLLGLVFSGVVSTFTSDFSLEMLRFDVLGESVSVISSFVLSFESVPRFLVSSNILGSGFFKSTSAVDSEIEVSLVFSSIVFSF
jgi:hypothetical protein